jgi:1-acyl-sn-glycerol-3-phosphate acyltransferase
MATSNAHTPGPTLASVVGYAKHWIRTRTPSQATRTTALRWLYAPWVYVIFIPFLGLWTALVLGTIAMVAKLVSGPVIDKLTILWARPLCWANFTSVEIKGDAHIAPGQSYVIISNHQSLFDILAIAGYLRMPIRWVMKASLRKVPFLGSASAAMGNVFIDRSNHEKAIASLKNASARVSKGVSVVFFPEGTRSPDGQVGAFKKGAFVTALDLGLPILPLSISGSTQVLPKGSRSLLPGRITITIHEPVEVGTNDVQERDRLMVGVHRTIAGGLLDGGSD